MGGVEKLFFLKSNNKGVPYFLWWLKWWWSHKILHPPKLVNYDASLKHCSRTSGIGNFPTISQIFRSSSPTISPQKLHGFHDISETKFLTFPFFKKCLNYFAGHFLDRDKFLWIPKCNKFPTYSRPKSNSQLFPKFPISVGTMLNV